MTSVRVADDGCGMTLDIIESALLVLFRSTKDEDSTKIGKYGVGFMSVLAIDPSEVTIDTWRGPRRIGCGCSRTTASRSSRRRRGTGTGRWCRSRRWWQRRSSVTSGKTWWGAAPVVQARGGADPLRSDRRGEPGAAAGAGGQAVRGASGGECLQQVFRRDGDRGGADRGVGELPSAGSAEDDPAPFAGFYNRG
ncbi:MAG: ATP-binding protein [Polyangiaceae bacterium]